MDMSEHGCGQTLTSPLNHAGFPDFLQAVGKRALRPATPKLTYQAVTGPEN